MRPNSSEEVTGSRVVSPWAMAWVASVKAATGAVIRLGQPGGQEDGDADGKGAGDEGDIEESAEEPVGLGGQELLVHVNIDMADGAVGGSGRAPARDAR